MSSEVKRSRPRTRSSQLNVYRKTAVRFKHSASPVLHAIKVSLILSKKYFFNKRVFYNLFRRPFIQKTNHAHLLRTKPTKFSSLIKNGLSIT